jgi:hypothetical protein
MQNIMKRPVFVSMKSWSMPMSTSRLFLTEIYLNANYKTRFFSHTTWFKSIKFLCNEVSVAYFKDALNNIS